MSEALHKIERARAALIQAQPFFGVLALRLVLEETTATATGDVDGVTLRYNPEWIAKQPQPVVQGFLAHEVMHCGLKHMLRLGGRDLADWNKAADYAVNPIVIQSGLRLWDGALLASEFADQSAEQIYRTLKQRRDDAQDAQDGDEPQPDVGESGPQADNASSDPENEPDDGADGEPGEGDGQQPGGVRAAPAETGNGPASPAEQEAMAQDWEVAMQQAMQTAQAAGKLPGGLREFIARELAPKVDWAGVMRRFIQNATPSDYGWFPPNRRYVSRGLYLPSVRPDKVSSIAVVVDTSGSIDDHQLSEFQSELNAILGDARPATVHLIYCHAQVCGTDEITPDDYPVALRIPETGGTDFRPPFAWLEERGIEPVACIYLTDLECSYFPLEPSFPVLWVSSGRDRAPFGEVIQLPREVVRA